MAQPEAADPIHEEAVRQAKEWAKGATRLAVLALLESGESYGYQIVADLRSRAVQHLAATEAAIYPVLKHLEEQGHLRSRWKSVDEGVPPRKYYVLTARGGELLAELRVQWKRYRGEVEKILRGKT